MTLKKKKKPHITDGETEAEIRKTLPKSLTLCGVLGTFWGTPAHISWQVEEHAEEEVRNPGFGA